MSSAVKKRAVFYIGGYDPKSPDAFYTKLDRETARFEELWGVKAERTQTTDVSDDVTQASYHSTGDGWQVDTDFHFLTLDDIVVTGFGKPLLHRLKRYVITFVDYMLSGTAFKFVRHAWRFSLYFFYPAFMLTLAILISALLAGIVASVLPLPILVSWPIIFVAAFFGCVRLGGRRYHVLHLMDLWSFSRDFLHSKNREIESKLTGFAELANARMKEVNYDEVLLVGHSTGGALILDLAGRLLEKDSEIASGSNNLTVVTVGSTALKIGLHPAANRFRERVGKVVQDHSFRWYEFQCLSDVINFHRTDPANLMGLGELKENKPIVHNIHIKRMVSQEVAKRIRLNFFRIHYQFVFGNTERYYYDFPGICFGPSLMSHRVKEARSFMESVDGNTQRLEQAT